ncbi:DNA glycosylase [Sporormia fimetaria CBS 119925]|uniref:DNA glycosylase n=1 Tax=Sporormia fimetaria CBS 119925 TaxID=1340428 RepID=A0A6A6VH98_9PLEO|nr:DNA glycosylase [Sporormia fimetaria CBS 119925]
MAPRVTRSATKRLATQEATPPDSPFRQWKRKKVATDGLDVPLRMPKKLGDIEVSKNASSDTLKVEDTLSSPPPTPPSDHEQEEELPHNLGKISALKPSKTPASDNIPPKKRQTKRSNKSRVTKVPQTDDDVNEILKREDVSELASKAATTLEAPTKKKLQYTLGPGQSPFAGYPHPTPEECEEVNRLLSEAHGYVKPPKKIPPPSLTVTGCGEVPSILDAMIRTRLSANTSGRNSALAFTGLVEKFGILQDGIGKGSVDWDKVRHAPLEDVFEAIKRGGMANTKSKDIKAILEKVWEENRERRSALFSSAQSPRPVDKIEGQKVWEIAMADQKVLSLDHLHLLSRQDAFNALVQYPGIGVKTAACVLLFCLQRPTFAVDTHCFRLAKWLGWVPPNEDKTKREPGQKPKYPRADENRTFFHLDERIPDHLKYSLHQLFIKHGQRCVRCQAGTSDITKGWGEGCPIEHLVNRGKLSRQKPVASGQNTLKLKKGVKRVQIEEASEGEDGDDSEAETDGTYGECEKARGASSGYLR